MSRVRGASVALAIAVGVTGCGGGGSGSEADSAPSKAAVGALPTGGEVLFEEQFDDDSNKWGVIDHPEFGTASYSGGDYVWALRGRVAHVLPEVLGKRHDAGELDTRDVLVRAEATVEKGGGVVGVSCRETPDKDAEWQWFEFVARDGFAAIRHVDDKGNIEVLAQTKDVALPLGKRMTIEGACVGSGKDATRLSFALNGEPVLKADVKDQLGNGVPTLQAWTFPVHTPMDIRWHSFTIRAAAG